MLPRGRIIFSSIHLQLESPVVENLTHLETYCTSIISGAKNRVYRIYTSRGAAADHIAM